MISLHHVLGAMPSHLKSTVIVTQIVVTYV